MLGAVSNLIVAATGNFTLFTLELPAALVGVAARLEHSQGHDAGGAILRTSVGRLLWGANPVATGALAAVICAAATGLIAIAGAVATRRARSAVIGTGVAGLTTRARPVTADIRAGPAGDWAGLGGGRWGPIGKLALVRAPAVPVAGGVGVVLLAGVLLAELLGDPTAVVHGPIRAGRAGAALHHTRFGRPVEFTETEVLLALSVGATPEIIERAQEAWIALRISVWAEDWADAAVLLAAATLLVSVAGPVAALGAGAAVLFAGAAVFISIAQPISALRAGTAIIGAVLTVLPVTAPAVAARVIRLATALLLRDLAGTGVEIPAPAIRTVRAPGVPAGTAEVIELAHGRSAELIRKGALGALGGDVITGRYHAILRA